MDCDEVRPLLDVLHDGALNARDTAIVLEHLKDCSECDFEWSDMDALTARFKAAGKSNKLPSGLSEKISQALKKEDADRQRQKILRIFPSMQYAIVALLFLLVAGSSISLNIPRPANKPGTNTPDLNNTGGTLALGNLLRLSNQAPSGTLIKPEANLSAQLGFEPKFIKMDGWTKQRAYVYSNKNPRLQLAQFEFDSTKYGDHLYCFQSMESTIASDVKTEPVDVGGKSVKFGSYGSYEYALWTQNGRDYLVVAPMSRKALTELVHET
ncbi:MAG TPA: zf-HC2 domain-containing protein [Oculatellaceae cyanobacterium]